MSGERLFLLLGMLLSASCRQEMYDQPYLEPLERSVFFPGGQGARPEIPGTVARGRLELDSYLARELLRGEAGRSFPFEIDRAILERGRSRYEIFCSPCHGAAGYGDGTIVRRGFPAPPSFHTDEMRAKPPGHVVDVITHGFGLMYDYRARVRPRDRWAVAAYVQALQLSQSASIDDLPGDVRSRLEAQ